MKIASFNINNINRRLPNLLAWLKRAKPDIVALQELKAADGDFPAAALRKAGYGAVWRGQKTWNGVAILAKGAEPVLTRDSLPGDPDDSQSRYIEAASKGCSSPRSICPTAIPSRGRNSTTSSPGSIA
jgi:exodeoxyribonuclease-3